MNHCSLHQLTLLALASFGLTLTAPAVTVFEESFTGMADGGQPPTGTGSPWTLVATSPSTVGVNTATGNPSPSLHFSDPNNTSTSATLKMNDFAAFNTTNASQSVLTIGFDFRMDSYLGTDRASTFRLSLRDGGATRFTFGFGRTANSDLCFFASAGSSNSAPTLTQAIGLNDGFNFGTYSTTDALANGTDGQFVRVEIVYVNGETSASFNLSYGDSSTSYILTGIAASSFSNDGGDNFAFGSPGSASADFFVDNISVTATSAIPEPSTTALLLGGAGLIGAGVLRRRRG